MTDLEQRAEQLIGRGALLMLRDAGIEVVDAERLARLEHVARMASRLCWRRGRVGPGLARQSGDH